MKKTIFTLLLSLSCCWLAAQCPTGDITFSTQGKIDSFPINYPACTDFPGSIKISGSDISNLQGLGALDSIGGCFQIIDNPLLTSLNGLENLSHIGQCQIPNPFGFRTYGLNIKGNAMLTSINGLDSLKTVLGCVTFEGNSSLPDLNGLNKLTAVGTCEVATGASGVNTTHGLGIIDNNSMKMVGGFQQLDSLYSLSIQSNDSLVSLSGLENLKSLGYLSLEGTNSLTSFNELENLQSLGGLFIGNNNSLTSISGLENIDSLPAGISIVNTALTSLNGLGNIHSIGHVGIYDNWLLSNLSGLENIDTIHGSLDLNSTSLTSLIGLENIVSISGDLRINNNDNLTSLKELENLKSVGVPGFSVDIYIGYNSNLTSLSGLENTGFLITTSLAIVENPKLTFCNTQSICNYFENGGGAFISNNAPGCDNVPEVIAACMVSIEETSEGEPVVIFSPNPAGDFLQIQINDPEKWDISLCDLQGRQMFRQKVSGSEIIAVKNWPSGLYALRAVSGGRAFAGKIVKQ